MMSKINLPLQECNFTITVLLQSSRELRKIDHKECQLDAICLEMWSGHCGPSRGLPYSCDTSSKVTAWKPVETTCL